MLCMNSIFLTIPPITQPLRCAMLMVLTLLCAGIPLPALAQTSAVEQTVSETTGLPLPRFVSIRAEEVNVRTGPGERYPVRWILKRKFMPVEIVAEYETWRKIRDWQGTEGWVHQALLWGRRSAVVHPAEAVLRADPSPVARPVARLAAGVIGQIDNCAEKWCHFTIGKNEGWIGKDYIWGIYANEVLK